MLPRTPQVNNHTPADTEQCMRKTQLPWVALVGAAGAGKDTVAAEMVERYGYTRVAFADPVRAALLAINPFIQLSVLHRTRVTLQVLVSRVGWTEAKRAYPEVRGLLQRLGTEAIRSQDPDFWCDAAEKTAIAVGGPVVFTDARFLNELDMVTWRHDGQVVRIERTDNMSLANGASNHTSENDWKSWTPALTLVNYGDLDELSATVDTMMQHI